MTISSHMRRLQLLRRVWTPMLVMAFAAAFASPKPELQALQDDLPELCSEVYQAAASAIANRRSGATQTALRDALPKLELAALAPQPQQSVLLVHMHEILDDVYLADNPDMSTYPVYRAELCYRRSKGLAVPTRFAEVSEALAACSNLDPEDRVECAMRLTGSE